MSQRNGDKSRFNRVRRQNILRRQKNRDLRASLGQGHGQPRPRQQRPTSAVPGPGRQG